VIARQHAMHTERDIVMANLSVRLSVRLFVQWRPVPKPMDISLHFFDGLI